MSNPPSIPFLWLVIYHGRGGARGGLKASTSSGIRYVGGVFQCFPAFLVTLAFTIEFCDNLGQHRTMHGSQVQESPALMKPHNHAAPSPRWEADLAIKPRLSARYRFASANRMFSLATCFRRPRYRVLRYWNSPLTTAKTCSTLARTDDFSYSLRLICPLERAE